MTKQEIVKRITSVVWRTQGTKSEAERLLTEFEQAVREETIKECVEIVENHEFKSQNDYVNDMISDFRSELLHKLGHPDY